MTTTTTTTRVAATATAKTTTTPAMTTRAAHYNLLGRSVGPQPSYCGRRPMICELNIRRATPAASLAAPLILAPAPANFAPKCIIGAHPAGDFRHYERARAAQTGPIVVVETRRATVCARILSLGGASSALTSAPVLETNCAGHAWMGAIGEAR